MPDEVTQVASNSDVASAALLPAANFRREADPHAEAAPTVEHVPTRTVDSLVLDDPTAPDREPDSDLARLAQSFHACCRKLGSALGLARLDAARLTAEGWIFLLFHDAKTNRLSAVLGARPGGRVPTRETRAMTFHAAAVDATSPSADLPTSLADLRNEPGIIAAFVGETGESIANGNPESLGPSQLERASALSKAVLDCSRTIDLDATAAELRFAGRRLLLGRSGRSWVGVLAVSSVRVQWLRELVRHWAHALQAERPLTPGNPGPEKPAPSPSSRGGAEK